MESKEVFASDEDKKLKVDSLHQKSVNKEMISSTMKDGIPRKEMSKIRHDQLYECLCDEDKANGQNPDHLSPRDLNELYRPRAATIGSWILPRKGRVSLRRSKTTCQGRQGKSRSVYVRRRSSNVPIHGEILRTMSLGSRSLSVKEFVGTKIYC